jgi:plastocyanin
MPGKRLLSFTFLAIAAAALVGVACGGNNENTAATPTPTPGAAASPTRPAASPTAAEVASPTPKTEASPTSGPTVQPTTAPGTETVEISAEDGFKFDKATITVKAGSQVTLKFTNNAGGVPHNWSAYTDSTASEPIPGAKTAVCTGPCEEEITFTAPDQPGDYFFRCDVHPFMMGTLVVE